MQNFRDCLECCLPRKAESLAANLIGFVIMLSIILICTQTEQTTKFIDFKYDMLE